MSKPNDETRATYATFEPTQAITCYAILTKVDSALSILYQIGSEYPEPSFSMFHVFLAYFHFGFCHFSFNAVACFRYSFLSLVHCKLLDEARGTYRSSLHPFVPQLTSSATISEFITVANNSLTDVAKRIYRKRYL